MVREDPAIELKTLAPVNSSEDDEDAEELLETQQHSLDTEHTPAPEGLDNQETLSSELFKIDTIHNTEPSSGINKHLTFAKYSLQRAKRVKSKRCIDIIPPTHVPVPTCETNTRGPHHPNIQPPLEVIINTVSTEQPSKKSHGIWCRIINHRRGQQHSKSESQSNISLEGSNSDDNTSIWSRMFSKFRSGRI